MRVSLCEVEDHPDRPHRRYTTRWSESSISSTSRCQSTAKSKQEGRTKVRTKDAIIIKHVKAVIAAAGISAKDRSKVPSKQFAGNGTAWRSRCQAISLSSGIDNLPVAGQEGDPVCSKQSCETHISTAKMRHAGDQDLSVLPAVPAACWPSHDM